MSPSNRLQPNSSKSQSLSILSCASKNSRMSPIDINELGSDEKDDLINNKKYKDILGSICSPNNFSLAEQNDNFKQS